MTEPGAPNLESAPSLPASGQGAPANRPSDGRLLAIVLLGPVVGTIAIVLLPYIIKGNSGGPLTDLGKILLIALPFGNVAGFLSALMAAALYAAAYSRLHGFWPRLFGTLVIGAISGPVGVFVAVAILIQSLDFNPELVIAPGIAGAVALAATALPFGGHR